MTSGALLLHLNSLPQGQVGVLEQTQVHLMKQKTGDIFLILDVSGGKIVLAESHSIENIETDLIFITIYSVVVFSFRCVGVFHCETNKKERNKDRKKGEARLISDAQPRDIILILNNRLN